MNKTHKITTVAMMIAITSALMLIDRQFGFILADTWPIFTCAVVYFIYDRFEHNMAYTYGFCMILMSFVIGNILTIIYTISSVIGSLIICHLLNNPKRIQYSVLIFFIIEFIVSCLIYPLLGLDAVNGAKLLPQLLRGENVSIANIGIVLTYNLSLLTVSVLETCISFMLFEILKTRLKNY